MRIWTLHPRYLDPKGLVALWREALLARAVLRGETHGYQQHPQLERFRCHMAPRLAINSYLTVVHEEALNRNYAFDRSKIGPVRSVKLIPVTTDQVAYEWEHLLRKLSVRSPTVYRKWNLIRQPECHPLFLVRPGLVEPWERRIEGDSQNALHTLPNRAAAVIQKKLIKRAG